MCSELSNGTLPDWGEAWAEVTKAISRYGYMQQDKAYASMSPVTRSAVEKIGWYAVNMSENPDILRAQFRQVYEICARREIEDRQLPPALKSTINQIIGANTPLLTEREEQT